MQEKKQRWILSGTILAATVILSIIAYFNLPGTIAVQWSAGEVTNTMALLKAVLLSIEASVICLVVWNLLAVRFAAVLQKHRWLCVLTTVVGAVISCMGIVVNTVFLVMNGC